MTIIVSDEKASRGPKDAKRHRELQKDELKKHLPNIILGEDVISGENKGKKFVYRVRSIDNPDFRYGRRDEQGENETNGEEGSAGIGQGSGAPGGVIGKRPKVQEGGDEGGGRAGKGGLGSGVLTEADWEEILDAWFEDCGLPNLSKKKTADAFVVEYKISGTRRSGARSDLKKRDTFKEALRRFFGYMEVLKAETGKGELICFSALKDAEMHTLPAARELLSSPDFKYRYTSIEPFPIWEGEDMRFFDYKERRTPVTQAVIIAILDVTGSMDANKAYIAKSILFFVIELLRREYDRIIIRFMIHPAKDAPAAFVSEHEAFHTKSQGGTEIFQALDLADDAFTYQYDLINKYDGYVFDFSDGEDSNAEKTAHSLKRLIKKGISMFGYTELRVDGGDESGLLLQTLIRTFSLKKESGDPIEIMAGTKKIPIVGVVVKGRGDIRGAVTGLLKRERWKEAV